ncbi:MAG: deoxyribose-phosphate aldolase [Clostridiales bacterium]|nr:deoxyribose-phosphate aldolase [Clostridiales bacterium]
MKTLNQYFDHTNLKPDASQEAIKKLCAEAKDYGFYSVCVNSCHVALAARELKGTDVKVAAVVGFPLGAMQTAAKAFETELAVQEGAAEIDMVLNVGAMKEGRTDFVLQDIKAVVDAAAKGGAIVKVILETCLLTDEEIVSACLLSKEAGAAFVKTSTGFSTGGATAHHVKLMKDTVGDVLQVKASGGIRNKAQVLEMVEAGADRIGASASVAVMQEA